MSLDFLLITPPSRLEVYQKLSGEFAAIEPPVWSMLIAKYLKNRGYSVEILDAEADYLTHEETADRIINRDPKLAVYMIYGQQPSASTQCMPGGTKTAKFVNTKAKNKIKSIVIGTHASALPSRTLYEEPYDFVCQGEGPITLEKLMYKIQNNISDLTDVPGLWHKDKNKKIIGNKPAKMFDNLDENLPGQEWDLIDLTKYKTHNWHSFHNFENREKYASLQTSLGCPFKCTFCCINAPFDRNTIRFWSPNHIFNQIKYLIEEHGIYNIKIPDEMFVLNPKQIHEICDLIMKYDYGKKLNIWAYSRIDTLNDDEMLRKMQKSGFKWLAIVIESSSEHVRDGVIKGRFDNLDIEKIVRKVREMGFYVGANYIFGLPDDDLESMKRTLDLAIKINSEWANFYSAMAYPGSQLYNIAKKNNWMLPDNEGGPGWIGYSQHAYETLPLRTEKIKASEVLSFRDKAFKEYFSNPNYQELLKKTFGQQASIHVDKMLKHDIKRKHLFEDVSY